MRRFDAMSRTMPNPNRGTSAALPWVAMAALLAGCALGPARAPSPIVPPNANLHVEGVTAIDRALVDRVSRYTDFRGHGFADWHPVRQEMLVTHRKKGDALAQVYRIDAPNGTPHQITFGNEPAYSASFEPREGRYIVFARSQGGDEAYQLHRQDAAGAEAVAFTPAGERHAIAGWLRSTSHLLVMSVPLDRTAAGGSRASIQTRLWSVDPANPGASARTVAELPGPGWFGGDVSPDDRHAAVVRYLSATESEVWRIDLASGERQRLLPAPTESLKATHFVAGYAADGRRLFVLSDRAGEFRELMALDLASGALTRMSGHIPWDVTGVAVSRDGRWLAAQTNREGTDELRLFDAASLAEQPAVALPAGSIGAMAFHPRTQALGYAINTGKGPSQVFVLDAATRRGQQWTTAEAPPGVDPSRFGSQEVVRWTSFDGLRISGLINRPPARFGARRPVIIDIHGGPEGQATAGFLGRWNYFTEELGLAVIQPNVRGSSGFGKTFVSLDNGMKREDSVRDIGALLDWIATQPDLDPARVLVTGGSYGGYMALAVAVHYSDRIAGAIDIVGPSNFVSFLTHTESYRRDLRRAEYGDERDPAMRAFLERIAPLNRAERIRKPLFVIQGRNDPRVPYTESEQIVAKVRANGQPVWYLRAENEGHGFARKENADYEFYATIRFIEQVLLR
jgi:dipeptidyl aminopeptidase/acylaminoacyl peptidase